MIDKIQIAGFQSHKDTEISLNPGVNVIIGSSDSGKSSIIRALKWLFQNRPQGDSFKNNELKPKDEVSVCSVFDNGEYMSRERSSKVNQYATFEDITYKALRTDIPPDVMDMIKIKEMNIQSQHPNDQYFLLTDSPGLVAKKFNEVSGLEIMDKAMMQINKQVRSVNSEIKLINTEIESKKEQLVDLKWVPKASKAAKVLQAAYEQVRQQKEMKIELQDILVKLKHNRDVFLKYANLNLAIKELKKIDKYENAITQEQARYNELKYCISKANTSKEQLNRYKDIQKAQTSLKRIIKQQETISEKEDQHAKLRQKMLSIKKGCYLFF